MHQRSLAVRSTFSAVGYTQIAPLGLLQVSGFLYFLVNVFDSAWFTKIFIFMVQLIDLVL